MGTKDYMIKFISDIILDLCINTLSDMVVTINEDTNKYLVL